MGSVNNVHGVDNKRAQSLGKFWGSIDFEFIDFNHDEFKKNYKGMTIGYFKIGRSKFPVTYSELNRIIETCDDAQNNIPKMLSTGVRPV